MRVRCYILEAAWLCALGKTTKYESVQYRDDRSRLCWSRGQTPFGASTLCGVCGICMCQRVCLGGRGMGCALLVINDKSFPSKCKSFQRIRNSELLQ